MENLLDVVAERDRAVNLLETGETGEPGQTMLLDALGRSYLHKHREHYKPFSANQKYINLYRAKPQMWMAKWIRLHREKIRRQQALRGRTVLKYKAGLRRHYDVEDEDVTYEELKSRSIPVKEKDIL